MWHCFFFALLSYTSTPVSRFRFIDLDPAAVLVPVASFFYTLKYTYFQGQQHSKPFVKGPNLPPYSRLQCPGTLQRQLQHWRQRASGLWWTCHLVFSSYPEKHVPVWCEVFPIWSAAMQPWVWILDIFRQSTQCEFRGRTWCARHERSERRVANSGYVMLLTVLLHLVAFSCI